MGGGEYDGDAAADAVEAWSESHLQEFTSKDTNIKLMKGAVVFVQQNHPDQPIQCHLASASAINACLMQVLQGPHEKKLALEFVKDC
eukprot:1830990-Pyramimonas_sp.AAC.1